LDYKRAAYNRPRRLTVAETRYRLREVGAGIYAMLASDITSNAGVVVSDEQVLVVDGLFTPAWAQDLLKAIRRVAGRKKEVRYLVNTHYHADHCFGNQVFSPPAQIIAHANCRRTLEGAGPNFIDRYVQLRPYLAEEFKKVNLTLPVLTLTDSMTIYLDSRVVEIIYAGRPAHTKGDIMVYLPQDKVLFTGDLLFSRIFPVVDAQEGSALGFLDILARLDTIDVKSIVPGHGGISSKEDLRVEREYFVALYDAVKDAYDRGLTAEQAVQEIKMAKYNKWPAPERLAPAITVLHGELSRAGR